MARYQVLWLDETRKGILRDVSGQYKYKDRRVVRSARAGVAELCATGIYPAVRSRGLIARK
jgi:hypothetical protein